MLKFDTCNITASMSSDEISVKGVMSLKNSTKKLVDPERLEDTMILSLDGKTVMQTITGHGNPAPVNSGDLLIIPISGACSGFEGGEVSIVVGVSMTFKNEIKQEIWIGTKKGKWQTIDKPDGVDF